MKNLKILAAFAHALSVFYAMFVMLAAVQHWIPNSDAAWLGAVLIGATSSTLIWVFFLHDKYWYYSRKELEDEADKYRRANDELIKLRKQYVAKFEQSSTGVVSK